VTPPARSRTSFWLSAMVGDCAAPGERRARLRVGGETTEGPRRVGCPATTRTMPTHTTRTA